MYLKSRSLPWSSSCFMIWCLLSSHTDLITYVSAPLPSVSYSPTGLRFLEHAELSFEAGPSHLLFNLPRKCCPQIFPWLISHHSGFTSYYLFTKVIPTTLSKTACLPSPFIAFKAFITSQKLCLLYLCPLKCTFHKISDPCFVYCHFCAAAAAKSLQLCPTLCDPIEGSPPGSPIPGILQARTLEWVAISFSNAWKWKVKVKALSRVWP